MRHDFSAQFLRVIPPDTSFGEAWESLCFDLLYEELNDKGLIRLAPPDRGVDILSRKLRHAYQCKSDERGAFGSLSAESSVDSLKTAFKNRKPLGWKSYFFCTNANYTGNALTEISKTAGSLGLKSNQLDFKGPKYWEDLCSNHFDKVFHRFDYRVTATEKQVIEALKAAGYFNRYLKEFEEKIRTGRCSLVIKNNRTPLELVIPFSNELTVKNCLDVAKEMLGISLGWTNFTDIGTSAGPRLYLTINKVPQEFSQKITDLPLKPGDEMELWIKIVWRDETQKEGKDEKTVLSFMRSDWILLDRVESSRAGLNQEERGKVTVERSEAIIQNMIWAGVKKLKAQG
jgi:hypothetical protein